MAIFKCKMCADYDGEWCHREKIIKTKRSPCDSCHECRIKLTEKMSFCPYQLAMPEWLVWVLSRMGFAIYVILAVFLMILTAFFVIGAFATLLEWEIPMTILALATAIVCLFLAMLCKSGASWIHNKYF